MKVKSKRLHTIELDDEEADALYHQLYEVLERGPSPHPSQLIILIQLKDLLAEPYGP